MGMGECPVRSCNGNKASEEHSLLPWGLSKASSLAIGMQQETSGKNHKIIVLKRDEMDSRCFSLLRLHLPRKQLCCSVGHDWAP